MLFFVRTLLALPVRTGRAIGRVVLQFLRPVLALVLVAGILSTVAAYMQFQESIKKQPVVAEERAARASYDLEITLTFDAAADSFALDDATSLLVSFRGKTLLKKSELVTAGKPLKISAVPGIVEGPNEFYLEAMPADTGEPLEHAVRLRIWQDENVIADQTLWAPPGEPVRGLLTLVVPATVAEESHEHE